MNRKSANIFAPVIVALLLLLPTILVVTPAVEAQQTVPFAPTVPWVPQSNFLQNLYLNFGEDETDFSRCAPNAQGARSPMFLKFAPAPSVVSFEPRPSCTFSAGVAATGQSLTPGDRIVFDSVGLTRSFNISGNNSLKFVFKGNIGSGWTARAEVQSGTATGVVGTHVVSGNEANAGTFSMDIPLGDSSVYRFERSAPVRLTLSVVAPANAVSPTWSIQDTGARLEVRSVDALRAATWTQDAQKNIVSVFRPLGREAPVPPTGVPRIVGMFAVDSAFGNADAAATSPVFSLSRGGVPQPVGADGGSSIPGRLDASLSPPGSGRAVYSFPPELVDYRGMPAGDYVLAVDAPYFKSSPHQGSSLKAGVAHAFLISDQGVLVKPFPTEELTHEVLPGSSTTFLLLVNNTGSANDTIRLDASLVSGSAAAWSAIVGGPNVIGREIKLQSNEEKLVTVTVTAPFAGPGESSIFLVNATSVIDPNGAKHAVTLVSRIGEARTRELQVIAPTKGLVIEAGVDVDFPTYVWNKGTQPANASFSIEEASIEDWSVRLQRGTASGATLAISGIRPGDISPATLVVRGPINKPDATHTVNLKATLLDAEGILAEAPVTFRLIAAAGVKVEIFDKIQNFRHSVELHDDYISGDPPPPDTANSPRDGIDGTWYRAWITNTGRITDTYDLSLNVVRNCGGASVFTGDFGIYFRDFAGRATAITSVEVPPGRTAELYVWRAYDATVSPPTNSGNPCRPNAEMDFALRAVGRVTGVEGFASAFLLATNAGGDDGLLVEGVVRAQDYDSTRPFVDTTNATRRTLVGGVEIATNATYFVRVTNAASWATHTYAGTTYRSDVRLRVEGLDPESGWDVSIRPRNGITDVTQNPYVKEVILSNLVAGRREGWVDQEIEVQVKSPDGVNFTALAGDSYTFFLQGSIVGSGDTSTLGIKTIVTQFANVTMATDQLRVSAHPGKAAPYLITLRNNGSSEARVSLKASMDSAVTTQPNWGVVLSENEFNIPAFRNRTVALLVTPPSNALDGVGEVNLTMEYAPNPFLPDVKVPTELRLQTEVVPKDSLTLTAASSSVTAAPGGFANFTFTLDTTRAVHYRAVTSPIPNWTAFLSPAQSNITGATTLTLVLRVPGDATNGTTFSTVLRVAEVGNEANFDAVPVSVAIAGGRAIASITVPAVTKTVDRGGSQTWEVAVSNLGSAAGRIQLEARTGFADWGVSFSNVNDSNNPFVDLQPNQLKTVNVTVRAPKTVPVNTVIPIEVVASAPGLTQSARATFQARIHDYGVQMAIAPTSIDLVPGLSTEIILKVRNTGNDNDTLNVSYATNVELPEWDVSLAVDRVLLEPGAERDVRVTIKSPTSPLPTPRAYSFKFFVGTLGGASVDIPLNQSATTVVNILRYVALDVDRDEKLELAVDLDKRDSNGYESFSEIFPDGLQTQVVKASTFEGKTRFFLDVPEDRYDGIADVWFDPESVYAYRIEASQAFDVTGDNAPDYFLDTNRDGKVDRVYDTETDRYLIAVEVKVFGDQRIQYLADTNNDARPDVFYEPEGKFKTNVQRVANHPDTILGLDTTNDGNVDKYYDSKSGVVTQATTANVQDFFGQYWYFFVAFVVMLLAGILLLVRRLRG